MAPKGKGSTEQSTHGIGEWYGRSFVHLTAQERNTYAKMQFLTKKKRPTQPCRPRLAGDNSAECSKQGGICSLRRYTLHGTTGAVSVTPGAGGILVTVCPYRFYEGNLIFSWIGQHILGHPEPLTVTEVGFLEHPRTGDVDEETDIGGDDVGRIDHVLVHPNTATLSWCALEMQAVYFSGDAMKREFEMLADLEDDELPFPAGRRRPDYRSSAPKRLMPQLQIKVPALRRWGKKMCVVVDRGFYEALGPMEKVRDVSNCDIVWFVVRYEERGNDAVLTRDCTHYTTLERAVEGLTAGDPVSLSIFEDRIRAKLPPASAT
jgi:hypothetical protein